MSSRREEGDADARRTGMATDRPTEERSDRPSTERTADRPGTEKADVGDRTFGWRGWVLVALLVFSFLVGPALVLVRPPALPYFFVLIVVPLLSGLALGAVAVWAAIR